jgi:DNA modification methylase
MKPVALIAAQLANSSRRGDPVLDLFAGSGSTLIASEQLGRRCYAVELDPRYCDVIRRRYREYRDGR